MKGGNHMSNGTDVIIKDKGKFVGNYKMYNIFIKNAVIDHIYSDKYVMNYEDTHEKELIHQTIDFIWDYMKKYATGMLDGMSKIDVKAYESHVYDYYALLMGNDINRNIVTISFRFTPFNEIILESCNYGSILNINTFSHTSIMFNDETGFVTCNLSEFDDDRIEDIDNDDSVSLTEFLKERQRPVNCISIPVMSKTTRHGTKIYVDLSGEFVDMRRELCRRFVDEWNQYEEIMIRLGRQHGIHSEKSENYMRDMNNLFTKINNDVTVAIQNPTESMEYYKSILDSIESIAGKSFLEAICKKATESDTKEEKEDE